MTSIPKHQIDFSGEDPVDFKDTSIIGLDQITLTQPGTPEDEEEVQKYVKLLVNSDGDLVANTGEAPVVIFQRSTNKLSGAAIAGFPIPTPVAPADVNKFLSFTGNSLSWVTITSSSGLPSFNESTANMFLQVNPSGNATQWVPGFKQSTHFNIAAMTEQIPEAPAGVGSGTGIYNLLLRASGTVIVGANDTSGSIQVGTVNNAANQIQVKGPHVRVQSTGSNLVLNGLALPVVVPEHSMVFPSTRGASNGQVLTTNIDTGVLTWTTPSGGGGGGFISSVVADNFVVTSGDLKLKNDAGGLFLEPSSTGTSNVSVTVTNTATKSGTGYRFVVSSATYTTNVYGYEANLANSITADGGAVRVYGFRSTSSSTSENSRHFIANLGGKRGRGFSVTWDGHDNSVPSSGAHFNMFSTVNAYGSITIMNENTHNVSAYRVEVAGGTTTANYGFSALAVSGLSANNKPFISTDPSSLFGGTHFKAENQGGSYSGTGFNSENNALGFITNSYIPFLVDFRRNLNAGSTDFDVTSATNALIGSLIILKCGGVNVFRLCYKTDSDTWMSVALTGTNNNGIANF